MKTEVWILLAMLFFCAIAYQCVEYIYPYESYSAWQSVKFSCDIVPKLEKEGNFSYQSLINMGVDGYYNTGTREINILVDKNSTDYESTYAHELCHANQKISFPCIFRIGAWINEIECYIKTGGIR